MPIEVKVPVLPESVSDATIASWHKKPGDSVRRDENLVDLETDKVVLEVPAPADGVLSSIEKEAGSTVNESDLLALLEEGAAEESEDSEDSSHSDTPPAQQKQQDEQERTAEKETSGTAGEADEGRASPAARKLMDEHELTAGEVQGTGRDGRITKEDVQKRLDDKPDQSESDKTQRPPATGRTEERVPMSRIRTRIAERLLESQQRAALLTSFNEVDLGEVMALRKRYRDEFIEAHEIKLGIMSFFVKAAVYALKRHPIVNASVEENDIIYHSYQDIGIAVSTDRGLVVPIIRDADQLSLAEIERKIGTFATQAREGGLQLEDLQGGTFSITNGGVFGSLISTPIVNPPQSAILGMHTIKERPAIVDGEIVARPMMYIALTYDHRIIDGRDAVLFLVDVKNALEDPARLLLDI